MHKPIHNEVVELLLDSMSQRGDDYALRSSFFFGEPGAPHWQNRGGTDVYYQANKLVRAALHVRQHGPAYLKYLSLSDIWSMLQRFVVDNYWYLAQEAFLRPFAGTYANHISSAAKLEFAHALAASEIFQPRDELTLFPIVPLRVEVEFDSSQFFLIPPSTSSLRARLPNEVVAQAAVGDVFPPLSDWKGKREVACAWLGVRSPALQASNKMKAAILGAMALTPLPQHRHMFSGRQMFGGRCTITDAGGTTVSYGEPHTPAMMHDIVIGEQDVDWLNTLAHKLISNERAVRRQMKALEYFYRAWSLEPSERFPVLCMTLDAIFGDANHATQAVIDGVRSVIGTHVQDARLRLLMDLRASVIHGGAPDVYDSRKYGKYYDGYGEDPIRDMELVVGSCLRKTIFGDSLKEHTDPNAAIIAAAQASGRLPKNLFRKTILDDGSS
jgi:hypothetical protein